MNDFLLLLGLLRLLVIVLLVLILLLVRLCSPWLWVLGLVHWGLLNWSRLWLSLGLILDRYVSSVGDFLFGALRAIFILDFFLHFIHDSIHYFDVFVLRSVGNWLLWSHLYRLLDLYWLHLWLLRNLLRLFVDLWSLRSYLLNLLDLSVLPVIRLLLILDFWLLYYLILFKISNLIFLIKIATLGIVKISNIFLIPIFIFTVIYIASRLGLLVLLIWVTLILVQVFTNRFKMTVPIILVLEITFSIVTVVLISLLLILRLHLMVEVFSEIILASLSFYFFVQ